MLVPAIVTDGKLVDGDIAEDEVLDGEDVLVMGVPEGKSIGDKSMEGR